MSTDEIIEKLEVLETQQAFQEDTIDALNQVIVQQQKDIEQLNLKVGILQERVKQTVESGSEIEAEEPPPPHY